MKKLMNKKGFTLIEMLVVIAIIAILVAIIIPTVTKATTKAAAATNAANLRSLIAEASTDYLAGVNDDTGLVKTEFNATTGAVTFSVRTGAPKSKKCVGVAADVSAALTLDTATGTITANYGTGLDVDYFSYIAEHGEAKS
ncbi:MAG: prepilin-type N-terminal cleavage/methylation domain-containing protein [Firmicutes bacterium]|nr:prepilin-type N-terminal cleavage/methylation domain-containing protein [Bacillota bacterium]